MSYQWVLPPLFVLMTSCTAPLDPEIAALVGRWETEPEGMQPRGSLQYHLTIAASGRFTVLHRMHGVYAGQPSGALSAYSRHEGRYTVTDQRITFVPERYVWWDSFYGEPRPTVEEPSPYASIYDDATFEINGRRLTLRYTTYPLDAPVPTMQTFRRVGRR